MLFKCTDVCTVHTRSVNRDSLLLQLLLFSKRIIIIIMAILTRYSYLRLQTQMFTVAHRKPITHPVKTECLITLHSTAHPHILSH